MCLKTLALARHHLNCAYHFQSRFDFFKKARKILQPAGKLASIDITVNLAKASFREKAALKSMALASKIPLENLVSADSYRSQLEGLGFKILENRDISRWVFPGFHDFIARYFKQYQDLIDADQWHKFKITASTLNWLYKRGLIEMRLFVAESPKTQQ